MATNSKNTPLQNFSYEPNSFVRMYGVGGPAKLTAQEQATIQKEWEATNGKLPAGQQVFIDQSFYDNWKKTGTLDGVYSLDITPAATTTKTPESTDSQFYYTDYATGQPIYDVDPITGEKIARLAPEGSKQNIQYPQYVTQAAGAPQVRAKQQAAQDEIIRNQNLIKQLSQEQLQEMRSLKMTPEAYIKEKQINVLPFGQAGAYTFADGGPTDLKTAMLNPDPYSVPTVPSVLQRLSYSPNYQINPSAYISGSYGNQGPEPKTYQYGFISPGNQSEVVAGVGLGVPKIGLEGNFTGVVPMNRNPYFKGVYTAGLSKNLGRNELGIQVTSPITGYTNEQGFQRDPMNLEPRLTFKRNFAAGGDLDTDEGNPTGSPLDVYDEVTYGELPEEVKYYLKMPGVNSEKVVQWFSLGLSEPQTFNQAVLLAEAVGYNPEQAKVVAAQWQMESSGGARLSSPYNYFGIKSHNEAVRNKLAERGINVSAGKEAGTTEVVDGKKVSKNASFMEFNNAFEGFAAHKAFLETNSRYAKALTAGTAKEFAIGLEKAGYATAPNYGTRLYQDYVAPKERNPKAGDTRPKSLGETKSQKIKPYVFEPESTAAEPQSIPMLPPAMLEASPVIPLDPTTTEGMYGSVPSEQKVEETKAIPMDAPAGFFGGGKTMFKQGGSMNFKSPGAYHKWLGYVHATGLAESTPGHQKVSIGGEPHKVEHQYGGHLYAAGGSFNNPGFNALPTEVQNKIKANSFAEGGNMGNQLTQFDGGFKHDDPNPQNVFSGIPQGFAPDQKMNIAEKDETKFENYIFSDNLKVTKDIAETFNLPKSAINKTYADVSKNLNLNKSRRENDTIEDKHKEKMLNTLREAQETFKAEEEAKDFAMMAEKYPEKMAAMMQAMQASQQGAVLGAPGGQMMEAPAGEIVAAGMNPAQEMPSPEPVPTSQLPMSYGGSLYGCGGKMYEYGGNMYDFGGWMDDNSGAVSGAGTGALSGASTGATIGSVIPGIGTVVGAGIGALVGGIAGGVSGHKKDKLEQTAEELAQQEQIAQGNQMQQSPTYVTPAAQYALNAGMPTTGEMPGSNYMAKNGGPLHHQYPQLNPMWKNNAGPMGQGLANTQVYAMGGHMYDGLSESTGYLNYNSDVNNLLYNPWLNKNYSAYNAFKLDTPTTTFNNNNTSVDNKSKDNNSGNYNVDTTLTDTTQDLSVIGTPIGMLTNLAPIAYNFYQGLSKPRTYTPEDFYVRQEAIRPDYTQAENEARYSYAQLMDSLGASGLSGGNYMSNAQQAANVRNKGMAAVAMAEENAYREDQAKVRAANALAETDAKKLALQTNWAQQAAKQEHIKEALGQAKGITDADLANELAYNYAIMGAPDISKFKKIGYTPYGEYFRERYLTRKNKEGK